MHVKHLERFSYEAGGATVSFEPFEPRKVLQALIKFHSHSIEHIYLDSERASDEFDDDEAEHVRIIFAERIPRSIADRQRVLLGTRFRWPNAKS
jgi:hypothetical protein